MTSQELTLFTLHRPPHISTGTVLRYIIGFIKLVLRLTFIKYLEWLIVVVNMRKKLSRLFSFLKILSGNNY